MKTGVYFNNCEVSQDMHPSQVRYLNRYTSVVPSLPVGKPMPAPPKLLTQCPCKIELPPSDQDVDLNQYLTSNACKHKTESKECEAEPAKRRRTEKLRPNNLSSEEQVFIEAAFELSESCNFSRKFSPRVSSTIHSPKSVLQGLPPPPFFLASSQLDLKDSSKQQSPWCWTSQSLQNVYIWFVHIAFEAQFHFLLSHRFLLWRLATVNSFSNFASCSRLL